MNEREAVVVGLRRHALRRGNGLPTISVFVGSDATSQTFVKQALEEAGLRFVMGTSLEPLMRSWLTKVDTERDLQRRALALVSGDEDEARNRTLFRAKSPAERRRWFEMAAQGAASKGARNAAHWLLNFEEVSDWGNIAHPRSTVEQTLTWLPQAQCPALCLIAQEVDQLAALTELASAMPTLRLATVIDRELFRRAQDELDSRAMTYLKEGMLLEAPARVEAVASPVAHQREHAPVALQSWEPSVLREVAMDSRRAARVAQKSSPAEAEQLEERARSLAEQLLFELLQRDPATRGVFRLNGNLPVSFGSRDVEIDLLCEEMAIAVEVDGYYHFQDQRAYRRDRRKDLLLQKHGYWIARYLADDVIDDSGAVIQSIRELVRDRKARAPKERGTR